MAAITENLSNLNVDNEDVKMHRYGVNVTGVKQVLKSKVSTLPQAEERDVKKLLEKYKDSIEKLKTKCKDILSLNGNDPGIDLIYDDIFILRYVLSKKNNLKKAEEAIRVCCKWRADPEIREQVLKPVADNTWTEAPVYQSFCKHMCFGVLGSQVDGGCLFYLRDGLGFPNTVFESLKRDEFLKIGFQSREYIYRWCDYETRRLGRLVKAMFILDMDKVKLSKLSDSRVQKCYAELGEFSENNNPQMVDKYLVVNAPSFIPWFISFQNYFATVITTGHLLPLAIVPPVIVHAHHHDVAKAIENAMQGVLLTARREGQERERVARLHRILLENRDRRELMELALMNKDVNALRGVCSPLPSAHIKAGYDDHVMNVQDMKPFIASYYKNCDTQKHGNQKTDGDDVQVNDLDVPLIGEASRMAFDAALLELKEDAPDPVPRNVSYWPNLMPFSPSRP
eukprot:g2587.t1